MILVTGIAYIVKLVCGRIKGSSTRSPSRTPPDIECQKCPACVLRSKRKFTALDISAPLLSAGEDQNDSRRLSLYDNVSQQPTTTTRPIPASRPIVIPVSKRPKLPTIHRQSCDYDVPKPLSWTFPISDEFGPKTTTTTTTAVPELTHGTLRSPMKNLYALQDTSGPYEIMLPRTHIYNSAARNN